MIKAAMKRADITPPQGLELAGYPHYPRYNEGHHDPLYAACMYLNNGEQEVAMVTLDLLFFSKKHVTDIYGYRRTVFLIYCRLAVAEHVVVFYVIMDKRRLVETFDSYRRSDHIIIESVRRCQC